MGANRVHFKLQYYREVGTGENRENGRTLLSLFPPVRSSQRIISTRENGCPAPPQPYATMPHAENDMSRRTLCFRSLSGSLSRLFLRSLILLALVGLQGCSGSGTPATPERISTATGITAPGNETPSARLFSPDVDERAAAEILEQRGAEIEWNEDGHVSSLNLYWTDVQDDQLPQLAIFNEVTTLLLPSQTTDAGLAHLRFLPQLEVLFPPNGITDAGLMHVRQLRDLRELHMYGSIQITDAGLKHLSGLSQLEYIGLQHTELTGAGIAHLLDLPNLRWISLAYTGTSDAELDQFSDMRQLRGLSLFGANVTDKGVERLQQALPDCVVMHR